MTSLTISEEEPSKLNDNNSKRVQHSMSRCKSYTHDLASLAMLDQRNAYPKPIQNDNGQWGHFVDEIS
eukprot:CAMPEP_0178922182 /NCGR_PEP_ID=MMETSP0786-20121207/16006_1 /TAXON_ID=186022 /ORGANISM="Thalassionema frauenfeldii, Strain CCMP 1798" /LENGTH=67 /DNA_ID=CAMNT_0020596507 /DNA_START=222 /DNA_END=425 /DNA_ORIENTATION=+